MVSDSEYPKFNEVVTLVEKLVSTGEVFIGVAVLPQPRISLQVDKETLKKHLEQIKLTIDEFESYGDEMGRLISACLRDNEDGLIEAQASQWKGSDEEIKERKGLLRGRLTIVRGHLISDELKRRFAFKESGRAPMFFSLTWDVNVTYFSGAVDSVRYAHCQLRYQKMEPLSILERVFDPEPEVLNVDLTGEEIDHVVKTLTAARSKLDSLKEGRRGE